MNYELAYRVGFHPWEDAELHPPRPRIYAPAVASANGRGC
jgi:hypothetical protein